MSPIPVSRNEHLNRSLIRARELVGYVLAKVEYIENQKYMRWTFKDAEGKMHIWIDEIAQAQYTDRPLPGGPDG